MIHHPSPVKKKKSALSSRCTEEVQNGKILVGDWVTVIYEDEKYPGIVTAYDEEEDEFQVKTMSQFQYQLEQCWRWPDKEDKIYYPSNAVSKYTAEPEKLPTKCRAEGLFHFHLLQV